MVKQIWFDKRTHPKDHGNSYWLSTKCVLASDQSSVRSWPVQPFKELSSAAGRCAGRVCALVRRLSNKPKHESEGRLKMQDWTMRNQIHFVNGIRNAKKYPVVIAIARRA